MASFTSFVPRLHTCPRRLRTAAARTTPTPRRVAAAGDSQYLHRWIAHQAVLYGDLLKTIASAPHPPSAGRGRRA